MAHRWVGIGVIAVVFGLIGPVWLAFSLSYPHSRPGASISAWPPAIPESLNFVWHPAPVETPALSFTDPSGTEHPLSHYHGRYMLLNFWATWCAPCLREMPALDRAKAALDGPDFAVVVLNQDRAGMVEVGPYWEKQSFDNLEIFLDKKIQVGRALKLGGLPTTILFNRQGQELARLEGIAEWDSPEALRFFRGLMAR